MPSSFDSAKAPVKSKNGTLLKYPYTITVKRTSKSLLPLVIIPRVIAKTGMNREPALMA